MKRQSSGGLVLGIGVSLVAIGILILLVDWHSVFDAWRAAALWVLLPGAICVILAMYARAMAWRALMGNATTIEKSFWDLQISYLLNNILPFRMGDIARAMLISRPTVGQPARISSGEALSAVAVERVLDLVFAFAFLIAILPWIAGADWAGRSLALMLVAAVGGFAFLLVLSSLRTAIMRWMTAFSQKVPTIKPLLSPLDSFLTGLTAARSLRRSVPAILWLSAGWIFWILEYWIVLEGFHPGGGFGLGFLALVGGMAGVSIPSAPGSLGVYEGAVSGFLSLGGIALATATAFAIALHVFNILLLSILGILGLTVEGESLTTVLQNTNHSESPQSISPDD
jgi:glycosyltransferase 2 family protein